MEDDEHDRAAFQRAFKKSAVAVEIQACVRAEEALENLSETASSFDIIVTDFLLPGISGLELCKELLDNKVSIPLLILTGSGSEHIAVEAIKAGVEDYIVKDPEQGYLKLLPFVIRDVVHKHMDRQKRKQAEEALAAISLRQQSLLEAIPDIVMEVDTQKKYKWANQAGCEFFGADVIGREANHYFEDEQDTYETMRPLFSGDESVIYVESWQRRKDGQKRLLAWWCRVLKDEQGNVVGAISTARDITEQRGMQSRTEAILAGIADTFYSLDNQWRFAIVNPAAEKAPFGRPAAELIGNVIWDLYPNLVGSDIHGRYLHAAEKHNLEHYEAQSPLNGRWYEVFMQGWHGGVDVYMRDITERMQTEEALRESEDKFRQVFDISTIGKSITYFAGEMHANNAFYSMLGYSQDEFRNLKWQDITHPDDIALSQEFLDGILSGKKDSDRFIKRYIHKNGSIVWADVGTTLRRDNQGKPLYFISAINDITGRKQDEFERELTLRMLEIINTKTDIGGLMKSLLRFMQELSGCEAVGIRLRDGDDFPYYETSGFPDDFVMAEKHLCTKDLHGQLMCDKVGNPILECMCGNIICGRFDPSKPFFTQFGSFISNNTTKLLASTTEEDHQARTRNRCNGEGYESVFLVPLRSGGETFGLLQFNDSREDCFSPRFISQAEGIAGNVAIALAQRRAEVKVRESRERYRTILQTAMDGYWLTDTKGYLIEVNDAYCSMSGYTESELLGMHISDLEALENSQLVSEHMRKVINEKADRFESMHQRKDGTVFDVEVSIQYRPQDNGLCVCFIRDISEQKQMENALRQSEALFRNLINSAPEGVFVQAEGRFLFLNPAMVQIFGAGSAAELMGTDFMERMAPEYHEAIRSRIRVQGKTGKPVPLMDQVYLRVDGSRIPVETTAVAIQYQGHGAHLVFVRDITERKNQEKTLKLQALVLDQICDLVTITDMEGVISYVNRAHTKVLGYGKEALIGNATQIFGEDRLKSVSKKEIVERTLKNGFWRGEVVNYDNSGQEHIMDCRTQIVFDEQEEAMAICGIATDITDYKRSEKALLESEVKFRTLVNQAPAALFLHDMESNIIDVNNAALKRYGYTRKQLLKMQVKDIDPDYIEREDKGLFWEQLKEKQNIKFEGRHRRKDGRIFPVSVSLSPIVLNGKNHIFALAIDMTDYKKSQEKLIESEERLRTVFEQAAVGVARVSPNGGFLEINEKFCQLIGYEKHELYRMTFRDITHPDDLYLYENHVEHVLAGEINSFEIEKRYIHKDGHPVWVKLYSNAIRKIDGEIKYAIAVVTDISERKLVENEREKLQNQLNQAQKLESIGNLAGGIAHDFNNILFPILGMTEMLLEDLAPGSLAHQNAQEIYDAGIRGSDLVKQILAFSRQSEHKKIPVGIQKVLREVLKLCRRTIPSDIEITQSIQIDCGLVNADPTQVHQIAMNLITNAYHAVEMTGGEISINLHETELLQEDLSNSNLEPSRYAVLTISDTGCGIEPTCMDKIFEPYFTTKEKGKGTGLGLAVVYGIVKEHHGDIKVTSEVGKGTSFTVYIPLIRKKSDTIKSDKIEIHPTGDEMILLVDDEESVLRLENQMLGRLGYRVTMRNSSTDALMEFRANPEAFDLVVSDMNMPNMTGEQFARKLMAIRPNIPVIICTGFSERIDKEKAHAIGIKGFLMKPVVKSELAQMVRKVLDEAKGAR